MTSVALAGCVWLGTSAAGAQSDPAATDRPGGPASEPPAVVPLRIEPTVPAWELGLGVTFLSLPDYRGADRRRNYVLPLPYATYRSDRLTVDRNGLKAELLDRGRLELDLSVAASVPVRSAGNPVREGMPALRPTLEVGPQLLAELWRAPDRDRVLQLQLPLRYVFSVSSAARDAGFTFSPRLSFDWRNAFGQPGWNFAIIGGPLYGTRRYHDYFYTVEPSQATADRPAYQAAGGFGGTQLTLGLSKRFSRHWFGAFVRADHLAQASFADSPLVRRQTTVAAGFAWSWIFAESDRRVPALR